MAEAQTGAHRRLEAFNAAHSQRRLLYYEVLGVPEDATLSDITRAFRKLSLKFHPDKVGGSTEKFQELSKAYKCLKDDTTRRKYDECGFDEDNLNTDEVDQFVDAFFGDSARGVDGRSPDWSMGKVENYIPIDLEEVPFHMKDIVRIGLHYMVSLDEEFENVVLLQHSRVDILYLMIGLMGQSVLTQELFESEQSYPITYYDNPLQPGIAPRWSDQNRLDGRSRKKKDLPRKELNYEEFQRRQKIALAMLENGPGPDPLADLEETYRQKMTAQLHDAARVSEQNRCKALLGQDVYEDDAELDVTAYAGLLAQKEEFAAAATSAIVPAAEAAEQSVTTFESQGRAPVLGLSSDGVLFAAQGGKVLRNEGPPRPIP